MTVEQEIMELLGEAKRIAQRYRELTGKPLGITGEVAEFEAARLLDLELVEARQAGYDAIRYEGGVAHRLQIKGRSLSSDAKRGQRIGSIDADKEFDGVLLVLMDEWFDTTAIYEADRDAVIAALQAPGSTARNERGALGVNKFKSIGRCVWPPTSVNLKPAASDDVLLAMDYESGSYRIIASPSDLRPTERGVVAAQTVLRNLEDADFPDGFHRRWRDFLRHFEKPEGPKGFSLRFVNATYRNAFRWVNGHCQELGMCLGIKSNTHPNAVVWALRCVHCRSEYGANSCDLHIRRCPFCQGGAPPERFGERSSK